MSIYDEIVLYCDSRIDILSICSCIKDDSAVHYVFLINHHEQLNHL